MLLFNNMNANKGKITSLHLDEIGAEAANAFSNKINLFSLLYHNFTELAMQVQVFSYLLYLIRRNI